ncbi:retrovirus-related pol polyprotein from transposon TNT 1-94 [Tanacetum coccineum]
MVEEEPVKKISKKELLKLDEELAFKLQAEEDEEERLPREKAQKVEEANIAWDDIQAKVEADYQRKHFAAKRVEEKRNIPPTKAQQRSFMCTYLKNMEGWKPKDLKNKSFANIQDLFDKAMKRVNTFVDMDTELVKESSKKAEAEIAQESSSKRAGEALEQESSKKQKVDDDKETEELKQCMEIISDDGDDVTIEATPLSTKSPTIVDYKIYKEGKKSYFQIIRADGNSQMYLTFGKMLKNFDREDLEVLWSIVKARFKKTEPVNYMDTFLHLNLKTMFEHHLEDNVWKNQQGLVKVLNWKLYDSCGVHCVTMQNILYYLLVEKMYPLTKHTLHQMFNDVKLQVDYECEMAFELLRLVKKQLKEGYGRIVGIKSLLEVTVVKVLVTAAKHKLVLMLRFGPAFCLLRLASKLRFASAFCLVEDLLAFCLGETLPISIFGCVLSKDITAFFFKTSLCFASRHLTPNGDALRKCILKGPYTPTIVTTPAVPATEDSPAVPEQTTVEITAQEIWEAIERLQQGESLNIQDVKTNLFWEFGQFTSHDGETIESYYTRFYKMMNEMIRNNLIVATMQVNVQFLQQLQPEWLRFVTIVKQQHKLDEVSYHKLFDILKQYQKEVNELRAERMAKNANPLALVATAQTLQDPYYQTSKPHKSYAPTSKASLPTRSHATTRYKGKEIAKPITPPSESASEEDSDPEQAQKDKDMQKNLALIAKYFKKLYKPTNNNLRTSSNTRNKNVDTTPRYKNDNQTGQFGNQRAVNVVGARETVGGPVVQQSGIQCFNCKEFGHYAKECRKPKRVKDSTYHKEKMLLCKQAEKGVQLQAEQSDWLADTDEEIDEQELEAHYSYMAKIQEVPNADSGTDAEPLEQVQYDTDDNVFANDIQHLEQSESICQ